MNVASSTSKTAQLFNTLVNLANEAIDNSGDFTIDRDSLRELLSQSPSDANTTNTYNWFEIAVKKQLSVEQKNYLNISKQPTEELKEQKRQLSDALVTTFVTYCAWKQKGNSENADVVLNDFLSREDSKPLKLDLESLKSGFDKAEERIRNSKAYIPKSVKTSANTTTGRPRGRPQKVVGEFRKEAFIPLFKSSFIGFETVLDNNDFSRLTDYLITWGQISNWLSDETKNDSLPLFLGEKSGVLPITKLQNFQERTLKQLGIDLNEIEDNKKQLFISYLVASVAAHTLSLLNQSSINPNPDFAANLQAASSKFFQ